MKIFMTFIMGFLFSISAVTANDENADLLGVIGPEQLQEAPYSEWYNKSAGEYEVDKASLADLDALMQGVEVKVVMGTWCHDSKREVPRFYKIINGHNANIEMIALDRNKQAPNGEIDGMGITNTPTFIFYKNGKELNRIVETPRESLEKDTIKILNGEAYRHSKMASE
ncbi:thioredoxin family protein [Pseudemcibacter aquimaris]|uniref:thioredoxin family protein n=1 Tax=Pseudemcibacter aquimaris TaxID=2857064 RepID=UPI0020128D69|nr:thioredoxin family protein [Pseudemcibacter aquimaris]MCC3861504.1 thioredoxin family protein [Pseudemcibacter aquimaris]WDU58273.1 thioredoxin family protein [Pseudemcibacter aquimaris]